MTEGYEDDEYLVRVRAQVMTRDDSSGGWVPMGGGGLSEVAVHKRPILPSQPPDTPADPGAEHELSLALALQYEYLIFGQRISDKSVIFSCTIKRDFEYNKVMPTFHHWKTGDRKFGLTFQAAADARAFDKGVRTAVEELLEGLSGSSAHQIYNADVDDDDVFMTLNLPVERGDSRSSSDSSARNGGNSWLPTPPSEHPHHHLHRISYVTRQHNDADRQCGPSNPWLRAEGKEFQDGAPLENYSYVQLTAVHEYTYPTMEEQKGGMMVGGGLGLRRESTDSFKKLSGSGGGSGGIHEPLSPQQPPLPVKASGRKKKEGSLQRARTCKYCQNVFTLEVNPRGGCLFAPDKVTKFVDTVSCIETARCLTYHCSSDRDGNVDQQTCQCGTPGQEGCGLRWLGLCLLSLFVPCLCLYPPLRACHWCGLQCGICGARHVPANPH